MATKKKQVKKKKEVAKKDADKLEVVPLRDALEQLFGSKTRVRMLRLLLDKPRGAYFVRELTRKTGAQLNSVRRELSNLMKIGIVEEVDDPAAEGKKTGAQRKRKFYQINEAFPFVAELASIMKKSALFMHETFIEHIAKPAKLDLVYLTGHFVDSKTQTDMLIVSSLSAEEIRKAITAFEQEVGREINYTLMTRDEFEYRFDLKDKFLMSLLGAKRVELIDKIKLT